METNKDHEMESGESFGAGYNMGDNRDKYGYKLQVQKLQLWASRLVM